MLIAAFPSVEDIGKKVAKALKAKYTTIIAKDFPDSEFHLKLRRNPENKKVVIINSLSEEPDRKIIETILAAGVARDFKAKEVILVATYLPYMRQDTHFEKYDSFSSKYIIKLFNEFDRIIAIDPHLHRINRLSKLSRKATSISVNDIIVKYIRKKFKTNFEIIGPDNESAQWSSKIANSLNKKVVILDKTRMGDAKIKQGYKKLDNYGNYIIIDDIISTGKTLLGAIKMAREQGAKKITCIGIHGVLVPKADKPIVKYAKIITTNTVPSKYAKIDISPAIIDELKKL